MSALAWRHVIGAVRLPAVWGAALFHLAALAAFLLVWGTGIPIAGARAPFEQFVSAQSVVLLAVTPWVVARSCLVADRDSFVRLAVRSAGDPAAVMLGAGAGVAIVAVAIAVTGLPLALLSHQISEGTGLQLAGAQIRTAALAACAATVTLTAVSVSGSRLFGWVLGTAAAILVTWLVPAGAGGTAVLGLSAAAVSAAAAQHAQRNWHYRMEYRT
jgi:hypothetical protein